MEELFQLIVALFIVSFPILNLFARRRQARRVRKRREREAAQAAAGSDAPASGRRGADAGERGPARPDRPRGRRAAGRTDVAAGERKGRFARWAERLEERARRATGEEPAPADAGEAARLPAGGGQPVASVREGRLSTRDDLIRRTEIGRDAPGPVSAGGAPETGRAAMERIGELPPLQQAVIWAEVLGRPKALRRTTDPWDDDVSS
jgi:hypothetical protein